MAELKTSKISEEEFNDDNLKPKLDADDIKFKQLADKHLEKSLPKIVSVYNLGKAKDFSAKQANLAKFATYGSETYGKLGFDPFKNSTIPGKSGMDQLYDENTNWTADIGRAWDGMWKLAGIGFQDTIGLGSFADSGNYLDFEETMSKYSSSRGGNAGFWSNTMLSSGYTMGIIGGIAAEELALAGVTALTGGTAAPATIAAGGTFLARGVARIKEAGNMLKFINKLQDVKSATGFVGKVGASAKGFGKALNPLENTMDFIFTADKLKDLNGWKQTALGAGAIVRDARKITMSHGESKLEADMAAKDFREKMYDDWHKSNPDMAGQPMPKSYENKIESEAQKVHDNVYTANFGLIYATNAITFDNMLKSMRGTNKFFANAGDLFQVTRKQGAKVAVDVLKKNAWNYGRKKIGEITWQGALKSVVSSSMEGFQELGQDVISESVKSYRERNVKGLQVRGGLMTYLENDLQKAINKQGNDQGLSTFLSGALMGVFASPVGFATQQTQNYLFNGGVNKTYEYFSDREGYKKQKTDAESKRKEKAKFLTEYFNNSKNFVDAWSKPIYSASEVQEQILAAAEQGDEKTMKNKQHESFVNGTYTLLESGMENQFADHLEYMAKNFDAQQLNEIFGRTDITEETKKKWQDKLQYQADNVKNLRSLHNEIQNTINNPISLKSLDVNDPEYLNKYFKYLAIENLKKELLFSHSKIADRANRQKAIRDEINKENPLSTLEVNALLDSDALEQQIQLLKTEVETNSKLSAYGDGAVQNQAQARAKLKAYENYQEKLNAYKAEQKNEKGSISESDAFDDLFDAYNNILEVSGKNKLINNNSQYQVNRQQFNKIFDYLSLGEESRFNQELIDTILNPAGSSAFIEGQEEMLKRLEENKEDHLLSALYEFDKKSVSNSMLNDLYDNDLFFDLQELDDLLNKGIMPKEIFDIATNKPATPEQYEAAQKIINSYVKKLRGKTITNDKTQLNKQGRKLKSDKRTIAGILRQYKVKLNEPIKLSSPEGQRLLDKLMAAENKYLTKLDREILTKLGEQDVTIKFVSDNTLPVQLTEDGVLELDLRFAGSDYINSVMSFENLVVTGLTQHAITEKLKTNDDLYLAARNAMDQAKKAFAQANPRANVDELTVFEDVNVFMTEAMNDLQFQKFLATVEDTVQPTSKSLWSTLSTGIGVIVEEDFDKKLANRVINIAAKALDDSIIDNISESNEESKEVKEQRAAASKEQVAELAKLATELGQRWNVNVKVLASQEEADAVLDKIQDPFYDKEENNVAGFYDEKTNTAYIVADAVKENTLYHEIFLHPFLINLEKTNPEFYKQLVAEAKSSQEIIDYVEAKYGTEAEIGSRQFEHELVGRTYALSVSNKLSEKKEPGLFKKIGQFIKRMLTKVAEFLNISKTDIGRFNPRKTTISDLANYSVNSTAKVNLGKIIEAGKQAQSTEATIKPRTRKKTVKSVRTVLEEQTVNKGGDLIVLDNASDRPDIFGDFLHPEIVFGNNLAIAEWTQKLVDLGQELDDARITNWVYGNIRAQVDGRLVIDVTVEVPVFVKKALKNKKANPRVAALQKEIAALDIKIQELNAQRKTATPAPVAAKEQTFEVHVGGIERGYTETKESEGKSVGDIRGEINSQRSPEGTFITKGATNGATQNDRFVVVYSKVDANGKSLTEAAGNREAWVATSVKISDNATQEEIDNATRAARIKMNAILPSITDGKFVLSNVDTTLNVSVKARGNAAAQDDSTIALKEFEKARDVLNFSKKKFPGTNMPLYQYLRMLNNVKPVVGQFAYYINRNNTSDPVVEKLGTITSFDNNSFTFIDANGKSVTRALDLKTIEYSNPYFLFSDSEVKNEVSYAEAEKFINDKKTQNLPQLVSADNAAINKEIEDALKQRNTLQDELNLEDEDIVEEGEETVQQGTKKVKFLMYKSIGKGSTAASAGEWVPLLAIGKAIDEDNKEIEWFVKAFHKGEDPKFNKYGSSVFADIDRDLKVQEANLFTEPENWVTEQVSREIEEETVVEEEIPVEEQEPGNQIQAEASYQSRTEILNDLDSVKNEIAKLETEYDKVTAEINTGKLSLIQSRKAKNKQSLLAIDINDLYQQLNNLQAGLSEMGEEAAMLNNDAQYVPTYDYNGNEIISSETPWVDVPQSLRNDLADLFGKPLNKLNEADVIAIKTEMKSNPKYISVIAAFSQLRLDQQNAELAVGELKANAQKVEDAKLKLKQQQQQNKANARQAKKQKRAARANVSDEDILKSVLKGYDYSILSPKEISQLVAKLKDKSNALIDFTVNDIVAFINNKKLVQAQKEEKLADIEQQKKEARVNRQIKSNLDLLMLPVIPFTTNYGKDINMRIPQNGMVKFITTYHPEIFSLPKQEFLDAVNDILKNRISEVKFFKTQDFGFERGSKTTHLKLYALFRKLEKQKKLYPEVVNKINLALYNADSKFRIRATRSGKNATMSSMYVIQKVKSTKRITPPGAYGASKKILGSYEVNTGKPSPFDLDVAIAMYFLQGGKVRLNALQKVFGENASELKDWKGIVSEKADLSKNSFDSASVSILEGQGFDVTTTGIDGYLAAGALEAFLGRYSSLSNAVRTLVNEIQTSESKRENEGVDKEEADERLFLLEQEEKGMSAEEAAEYLAYLKFLQTEEGQTALEDEAKLLDEYYGSQEFELLNDEFDGDESNLSDTSAELKDVGSEEEEDVADVEEEINAESIFENKDVEKPEKTEVDLYLDELEALASIPTRGALSNAIEYAWDNLNKDKKTDIVFAAAVFRFANSGRFLDQEDENGEIIKSKTVARNEAIIRAKISEGHYRGKSVQINGKVYRIAGYQKRMVVLQDVNNLSEYLNFEMDAFLNGIEKEVPVGSDVQNLNIDSIVKVKEFDYIKTAYTDILNNFTTYMGEANSLSEDKLISSLKEETTKCKT